MEKFNLEYFEAAAEERRIINEATSESLTVEILEGYSAIFNHLFNAFVSMKTNGNVNGGTVVGPLLKKIKSTTNTVMNKTDAASKLNGEEFEDNKVVKDAFNDIINSITNIKKKFEKTIIPSILATHVEEEPEETIEEPTIEEPTQEESLKPKRRKKIF
jgi:hypothetical protein